MSPSMNRDSASSSVPPSFWNRWTRLSSAPPISKQNSEDGSLGTYHTPSRKAHHHRGLALLGTPATACSLRTASSAGDQSDSDDEGPLPLTPPDAPRPVLGTGPLKAKHSSSPSAYHYSSRSRPPPPPPIAASVRSARSATSRYSLDSIRLDGSSSSRIPESYGQSSILAGFLKNNGGYLDGSDSEDDDLIRTIPAPTTLLGRIPSTLRSKLVIKTPNLMIEDARGRTRSVHSPVKSSSSLLMNSNTSFAVALEASEASKRAARLQKSIDDEKTTPGPTRAEAIVAEETSRVVWRNRRSGGQPLFRSLVLGEDDMLRVEF